MRSRTRSAVRVAVSLLLAIVFAVMAPGGAGGSPAAPRIPVQESQSDCSEHREEKLRERMLSSNGTRVDRTPRSLHGSGISGWHPFVSALEDGRTPSLACTHRFWRSRAESRRGRHAPAALQVFRH